jgi:hypothetical protein
VGPELAHTRNGRKPLGPKITDNWYPSRPTKPYAGIAGTLAAPVSSPKPSPRWPQPHCRPAATSPSSPPSAPSAWWPPSASSPAPHHPSPRRERV